MKVKIVKCSKPSFWYAEDIGKIYDVNENIVNDDYMISDSSVQAGIFVVDCELVEESALSTQIDGSHYKDYVIQPAEYCQKNKLNHCESSIVKYITRWQDKGGIKDLEKIKHYVDLIIEIEGLK